jgi:hypothetical protein
MTYFPKAIGTCVITVHNNGKSNRLKKKLILNVGLNMVEDFELG